MATYLALRSARITALKKKIFFKIFVKFLFLQTYFNSFILESNESLEHSNIFRIKLSGLVVHQVFK